MIVDPANPIVGVRSFGSDPALVARHVAAFVEGLQSVGRGRVREALSRARRVDRRLASGASLGRDGPRDARGRALPPFAAAVEAGVRAVMTAHIRFAALDDEPATLSAKVIGLLRSELGFGGLVITDALEMRAISATAGLEGGARPGARRGRGRALPRRRPGA